MKERDFQHLISLSTVELFENDYWYWKILSQMNITKFTEKKKC
jgi:hypothetical protein